MLNHYQAIVDDKRVADQLICKQVAVKARQLTNYSENKLWQLHEEGMAVYQALRKQKWREVNPAVSLFDVKLELAYRLLEHCQFCERRCKANRREKKKGVCGVGLRSRCSSEFLHLGEEVELIPSHTIFFSGCTFNCVYCQNWDIATAPEAGQIVEPAIFARIISLMHLQGAKNVNFVGGNPDPHLHIILEIIKRVEINTPMIWNSNMYTSLEAMKLLEGVIDLYLADFRYGNDECARRYSGVKNYWKIITRNFEIAYRTADVILRQLVLPGHLDCCTEPIMQWINRKMPDVYFNLMFQYHPCYRASLFPEIDRRLTSEERQKALDMAKKYKLNIG